VNISNSLSLLYSGMNEQPNAPGADNPIPEDQRRDAPPPPQENDRNRDREAEAILAGTGTAFLNTLRLDDRFTVQSIARKEPIIEVLVNFGYLRARIYNLLEAAFLRWDSLRNVIEPDRTRVNLAIQGGCEALATATIYLLYSFLRRKTSRFHPVRYNRYRNRCFFDEKRQIPDGIAYLIEQFGVTPAVEAFGNNRYIHLWDGEAADTYGVPNTAPVFDEGELHAFLTSLSKCGVRLRAVDNRVPARTPWDSLYAVDLGNSGLSVETTYPLHEYELPRDVFFVIGLRGDVEINNPPIQSYSPRLGGARDATRNAARADTDCDDPFAPRPGDGQTVTAANTDAATVDNSAPSGHIQAVHPTGVINRITAVNPGPPETITRDYHVLVYGRGPIQSTMTIKNVCRGLSYYEVDNYFQNLFRRGP
jgi:hypothetical protein